MNNRLSYRLSCSTVALIVIAVTCLSGCETLKTPSVPVYRNVAEGDFLLRWVCLDGVAVDTESSSLQHAFDQDPVTPQALWNSVSRGVIDIDNKSYAWHSVNSVSNTIDFNVAIGRRENAYTYALAEIHAGDEEELYLGVGSDDAVKIWLNGELVHRNWIFRGAGEDQDVVPITLRPGANRLTAKVLNGAAGWALSVRPISSERANSVFADAAGNLTLDTLDKLISRGLDIDAKNSLGLTALHIARLNGQAVRTQQLLERGASASLPLPRPDTFIPAFFSQDIDGESPGLAYLVAKDGEIIVKGSGGQADLEADIPLDTRSKFRIGSVTKQFTAAAVLKLQEEGKVSLRDTLAKYIPDFPRGDEVTLRQLLNHTSGIYNYTFAADFLEVVGRPVEQHELIEKIKAFDYDFDPGTSWNYSNSGYFLLGYIIEAVSGKSLAAFWEETFFQPLGMNDTGVYINGEHYENEALGYMSQKGEIKRAIDWHMSHAGAAGNLYSTVEDLFLWNEALFNGKVLRPESLADATTPAKLGNGEVAKAFRGNGYGLGVSIGSLRGRRFIAHGGLLHGYNAYLARIPEEKLTFVVLSNAHPSNLNMGANPFARVTGIVMGPDPLPNGAQTVATPGSTAAWREYTGQYDYIRALNTVSFENGRLYTQIAGQPKFELFHATGDTFYLKAVAAEIIFERDAKGKVVGATHIQGGNSFKVERIEQPVFITLNPDEYDRLLGEYQVSSEMSITITRKQGKLFARATGQDKFELLPLSRLEYRGKTVNIRTVFNPAPDNGDRIESFTLYQGSAVIKATKK